jgi:hypothetical protein
MVKLHGSVVIANTATVLADNGPTSGTSAVKGKVTFISNMRSAVIPTYAPSYDSNKVQFGNTTNLSLLTAPAVYDTSVTLPLIPELEGGPNTGGILKPNFYNQGLVTFSGTLPYEIQILPNASGVFNGFDQLFLKNNTAGPLGGITIIIGGSLTYQLPVLPAGKIWTTLLAPGTNVVPLVPITITQQPAGANRYVGSSVTFTVVATGGVGTLEYQWKKNGFIMPGQTSSSLVLTNLALTDAGNYTCVVSDNTGGGPSAAPVESAVAPLAVFSHLAITTHPIGGTAFTGDTFTFYATSTGGMGLVTYEWRQGSNVVQSGPSPVYFIPSVNLLSAGNYSVRVYDQGGDDLTSSSATLVVDPLGIVQHPSDVVAVEGDSVTLQVAIEGGQGPNFQWFRYVGALPQGLFGEIAPTLVLSPVQPSDAGEYYVQVSDLTTSLDSNSAFVAVAENLQIVTNPLDVTVAEGGTAAFAVVTSGGVGPLVYTWKKDGVPITGAPNAPVLTLPNVQQTDAGAYSVDVSDSLTTLSSTAATLTIAAGPPPVGMPVLSMLGLAGLVAGLLAAARRKLRSRGAA